MYLSGVVLILRTAALSLFKWLACPVILSGILRARCAVCYNFEASLIYSGNCLKSIDMDLATTSRLI